MSGKGGLFIYLKLNFISINLIGCCFNKGVGKSTLASSLAISLAKKGNRVGVVDLDICGPSINNMMKIKDENIVMSQWGWKPCE